MVLQMFSDHSIDLIVKIRFFANLANPMDSSIYVLSIL